MSSDNSVDGQVDWFFAYFIVPFQFLAAHVLPASMAAYVYAMECWAKCVVQMNRTVTAIADSFHDEILIFYDDDTNHYPVATVRRKKPILLTGNHTWTYDVTNQQFIHEDTVAAPRNYRIPYLGASLTYTDPHNESSRTITIGDLSEWMADQTIYASTNELPLQVLVSAWAYCQKVSLVIGYKGYVITVMNEEGDEVSYSLSEFEEVSTTSSVSTSISSSTEEARGDIEIIGGHVMIGERLIPQSLYDLLVPSVPTNTPLPASPETCSDDDSCEEGELKKDK